MTTHKPNPNWDPNDPHGFHAGHGDHGAHHVVPAFTNRTVLVILLFFTILTVAFSRFEQSIASALMVTVPHWFNVGVAMFIALIKGTLVVLFFMHIKYDNKLNAVVLSTCLLGLMLFIGLTMLDLDKRQTVYDFKAAPMVAGGTQHQVKPKEIDELLELTRSNTPIVAYAKQRYVKEQGLREWIAQRDHLSAEAKKNLNLKKWLKDNKASKEPVDLDWQWIEARGEEIWQHEFDLHHAHGGHGHHVDAHASNANQTRERHGTTAHLFDADAPTDHQSHDSEHDAGHAEPEHTEGH
ncbi:MAG: cytochrome C oxidase subunit IV family protein [Phycisphaeraceae bacterium]|nr:cytochrome C oxidase subunit IV family protein [Phycisphaerales bacterium]MCB9859166.1 cytochrome C oxidase subunit IV family protein [Phycisphaeraceae bacterium]